jgi:hypothetical protein
VSFDIEKPAFGWAFFVLRCGCHGVTALQSGSEGLSHCGSRWVALRNGMVLPKKFWSKLYLFRHKSVKLKVLQD